MFFILLALNLIFYIASGFTLYEGKTMFALIFLGLGLFFTIIAILYYKKRTEEEKRNIKNKLDCDCLDCDFVPDCDCSPDCSL